MRVIKTHDSPISTYTRLREKRKKMEQVINQNNDFNSSLRQHEKKTMQDFYFNYIKKIQIRWQLIVVG
jgi:hypothetical protein